MTKNKFLTIRVLFTIGITLVLAMVLLYQHFHDGIPSHHFLARKDMPQVSNVWGILTIPVLTWLLLWRVDKRIFSSNSVVEFPNDVIIGFAASLMFGIALGLSIQFGFKTFSGNVPVLLLVLALLFPTYRAEYFLGFVIGLTYFVGGVLPIVVGAVFLAVSALVYLYVRTFLLWIFRLIVQQKRKV